MLQWLLGLPDAWVYWAIGSLAAVENIFPPVPADTAAALGAYLSQRGTISANAVFGITWSANVGGAIAVYLTGRTLGRQFFTGRLGQRLLRPKRLRRMERLYKRYGSWGIFLSRFVPGVRVVVPAFAGIAHLSWPRAVIPMAVASGIWYAALVFTVARVAGPLEDVAHVLGGLNWGVLAVGLLFVGFVLWVILAGRRHWHTDEHATPTERE